jgi:hypothetical protein
MGSDTSLVNYNVGCSKVVYANIKLHRFQNICGKIKHSLGKLVYGREICLQLHKFTAVLSLLHGSKCCT